MLTCSIPAKADRLVCSDSEHARYMTIVGEVGEMGIDLNPVGQDRATFERLTTAYENLDPKGPINNLPRTAGRRMRVECLLVTR